MDSCGKHTKRLQYHQTAIDSHDSQQTASRHRTNYVPRTTTSYHDLPPKATHDTPTTTPRPRPELHDRYFDSEGIPIASGVHAVCFRVTCVVVWIDLFRCPLRVLGLQLVRVLRFFDSTVAGLAGLAGLQ